MKARVTNVAWLLPFLLTACFHISHKPQNPPLAPSIGQASPLAPISPDLPLSAITIPSLPTEPATTAQTNPPEHPTKPRVRHKKPVNKNVQQANAQQPSDETPGVSAIGQLSSGDSSDLRAETVTLISDTERALKAINRQLTDPEEKTAAQIREFLKQAKAALNSGDVDGAHTLALKAKVLLAELSQ